MLYGVSDHVHNRKVATAVYSRFVGSQYMNVTGIGEVWVVPCDQEVNMTFVIQGKRYPIHPLDTSMKPSTLGMADLVADGIQYCIGLVCFMVIPIPSRMPYYLNSSSLCPSILETPLTMI